MVAAMALVNIRETYHIRECPEVLVNQVAPNLGLPTHMALYLFKIQESVCMVGKMIKEDHLTLYRALLYLIALKRKVKIEGETVAK